MNVALVCWSGNSIIFAGFEINPSEIGRRSDRFVVPNSKVECYCVVR